MAIDLTQRRFLLVFLALLSLTTIAVAQSVYQAVVGNTEFIVLNQITHAGLWLIVFCFNLVPAVVLALLWLGLRRITPSSADKLLSFTFCILLVPFLLELHKRYLSPILRFHHNTALLVVPLAIAAWLVFRYRAEFERFLLVLSPVVLIFPGVFLWQAWRQVSPTVAPPYASIANFAAADTGKAHPPVFLLVLDEFTRPALLDAKGDIDVARFPHFVQLASQSTWFNNATANAEYTTRSIPVIVTGNFSRGNDASDASYPDNLFRLLAPEYDVTIHEEVTRFCASPEYHCPDAARVQRHSYLLKAVARLYLMRIAPQAVAVKLQAGELRDEQQRFQEFLGEIGAPSGSKPAFQFMHYELPHAPYMLAPDGSLHEESPAGFDPAFAGDTELIRRLHADYEMQIEFVDRELGRFIDTLKRTGLYDRSLILVTSDHGVSWKPNAPGRPLSEANAEMIFPVPLLIKLPGQTAAAVSSRDAQSIDLVPTIAAIVGVRIPWQVAGRNLMAPADSVRQKVMIDSNGKIFAYPPGFASSSPNDGR